MTVQDLLAFFIKIKFNFFYFCCMKMSEPSQLQFSDSEVVLPLEDRGLNPQLKRGETLTAPQCMSENIKVHDVNYIVQ